MNKLMMFAREKMRGPKVFKLLSDNNGAIYCASITLKFLTHILDCFHAFSLWWLIVALYTLK